MASRVNVRFVAILAVVLSLVGGAVAVTGYFALKKTSEELEALGDRKVTEAESLRASGAESARVELEYSKALEYYAKAVNKDLKDAALIDKWAETLEATCPADQQAYRDRYWDAYVLRALRGRAEATPQDQAPYERYLRERMRALEYDGNNLEGWQLLANDIGNTLATIIDSKANAPRLHGLRGIARVQAMSVADIAREETEQARDDLDLAMSSEPDDAEFFDFRTRWDMISAQRAKTAGRSEDSRRFEDEAAERATAFVASHPDSARGLLVELQTSAAIERRRLGGEMTMEEFVSVGEERVERIREAFMATPAAQLDRSTTMRVGALVAGSSAGGADAALEVIDHAIGAGMNDPVLLAQRGRILTNAREYERAMDAFQRVVDMPRPRLSFEGLILRDQKAGAVLGQINALFAQVTQAENAEEQAAVVDKIRPYRQRLAEYLPADAAPFLLVDARLDFLRGDMAGARTKAASFNEQTSNSSIEGLMLLGQVLLRNGSSGAAIEQFERVLERDSQHYNANRLLAGLYIQTGQTDKAVGALRRLLAIDPGNAEFRNRLDVLLAIRDGQTTDSTNPIVNTAQKSDELARAGDIDGAIDVLREGLETTNDDPGLMAVLTNMLARAERTDEALEVARRGAELYPNDSRFPSMINTLTGKDPLEVGLEAIEASNLPPLMRHIERSDLYLRRGRQQEAFAELDKAVAIDPEHPSVVAREFDRALGEGDQERVRALAATAERLNLDQVGGLTYIARVRMLDGNLAEAELALSDAVKEDPFNGDTWRLLGVVRQSLGRLAQAEQAIDRALAIKQSDLKAIVAKIDVMRALGRPDEALQFARERKQLANVSAEFLERWVTLEGDAPSGDVNEAIRVRTTLADADPSNWQNKTVLADLLIRAKRLDEADRAIEDVARLVEKLGPDEIGNGRLVAVELRARHLVESGRPGEAIGTYERYITSLAPENRKAGPYIALANLHVRLGQRAQAISVLEQAREYQDPKALPIDLRLAQEHESVGSQLRAQAQQTRGTDPASAAQLSTQATRELEQALALRRGALDRLPATESLAVRKQVVQTLISLERFAEAERAASESGPAGATDYELALLRADSVRGQRDAARAGPLYDTAVRLGPDEPMTYIKRAVFLLEDVGAAQNAISDLERALQLDASVTVANRLLAMLYLREGRWADAITQYQRALDANPMNDDVRLELIRMLNSRGRGAEALALAKEAMELKPDATEWIANAGEQAASLKSYREAAALFERLWKIEPQTQLGAVLVDALIRQEPPAVSRALRVIGEEWPEQGPSLRREILRSRIVARQNKAVEAREAARRAMELADPDDLQEASVVVIGMTDIFEEPNNRLTAYREIEPAGGYTGWMAMGVGTLKLEIEGAQEEGVSDLMLLAESSPNNLIRSEALKAVGSYRYAQKKYAEAADLYLRAVEFRPDDWGLRNNLAYTLTTLGRPQEALEHAEAAAAALPLSPMVLDTLGAVYIELGRLDEAERALNSAKEAAQDDRVRTAVNMHIAELRHAKGDRYGASTSLELVEEMIRGDAKLREEYQDRVTALRERLSSQ